jgi:hypothetical protein
VEVKAQSEEIKSTANTKLIAELQRFLLFPSLFLKTKVEEEEKKKSICTPIRTDIVNPENF